jgi:uncharacterized protein
MICADNGLSKLDEEVDAAYTRLHNRSSDGGAEKAIQLIWLRNRNECADMDCLRRSYESRIAELQARSASASAIVGFWKKEFACDQATGRYKEMCKQGARDSFWLAIAVNGEQVCIIHRATGQMGNRVDEADDFDPSMTGKIDARGAKVQFRSSYGGMGTALLHADRNVLHWKVSAKDGGRSWIPDEEVLPRVPASLDDRMPKCGH